MKIIVILLSLVLVGSFSVSVFAQEDDICGVADAYYNDSIGCEKIPQHCAQEYFDIKANEKRISKNIAVYDSRLLLKSAQAGLNNCMNPKENTQAQIPPECRNEYQKIAGAKAGVAASNDRFNTQIMSEKLNQYTTQYKECLEGLKKPEEKPVTEIRCGEGTIDVNGVCQVENTKVEKKKSNSWFSWIFNIFKW